MRKPIALLFTAALVLGLAGMASAQVPGDGATRTYTWTLIESAGVALNWPNQAGSPNEFEADGGLLGRVLAGTDPTVANVCELAPSHPCAAGSPPVFLLPAGTAEGPSNGGGGDECNRKVIACNTAPIPGAGHGGHITNAMCTAAGVPYFCCTGAGTGTCTADSIGGYSYLVIHTAAAGTNPAGKGIGFFTGSFVQRADPYVCNDCPPIGKGHDDNVGNIHCTGAGTPYPCCTGAGTGTCDFLSNTTIGSVTTTLSSSLWLTQSTPPFGHAQVSLASGGAGAGESSVCGSGLTYQDLNTDLCVDGLSANGNFQIPDQKTISHVYPVDFAANPSKCNGGDCYIQNVIIPAALAQNPLAWEVQILSAASILPSTAPPGLANATVDSLLFMFTTQMLDMDGDGSEDWDDPCPNDPTNSCTFDQVNAVECPPGEVFCADFNNDLTCLPAFMCNNKGDLNNDCLVNGADENLLAGAGNGVQGTEVFNTGLSIGPFDP
jgi:hypothetical protein